MVYSTNPLSHCPKYLLMQHRAPLSSINIKMNLQKFLTALILVLPTIVWSALIEGHSKYVSEFCSVR